MYQIIMTDHSVCIGRKVNQPACCRDILAKWKRTNEHGQLTLAWSRAESFRQDHILMLGDCVEQWSRRFRICTCEDRVEGNYACPECRCLADYSGGCRVFRFKRRKSS